MLLQHSKENDGNNGKNSELTYIAHSYVERLGEDGHRLSSIMQWLRGHRALVGHDSV